MDILGDDDNSDLEQPAPGFFSEPSTLALIAFPLSILVIMGAQVFRGSSYAFALFQSDVGSGLTITSDEQARSGLHYAVAGGFLTALFCLLPVAVGMAGLKRVIDDDPAWVSGLLRAAVALGALCFALRLVIAVLIAANHNGFFITFLNYT